MSENARILTGIEGCTKPRFRGLLLLLAVLASISSAEAGSVFMKNGYILQGPIVEREGGAVILGWPNGRVTIQSRFIDSIHYDPGEEKRLADEEALKLQIATTGGVEEVSILGTASDAVELPSTLEELMKTYDIKPKEDPAKNPPPSPVLDPPPLPAGDPVAKPPLDAGTSTTILVTKSEDALGDRVKDEDRLISLRGPKDWTVRSTPAAFVMQGPEATDGFRPSLNVVLFEKGPLAVDDCVKLLKEENEKSLQAHELIHEGSRTLGALSARELVTRGAYQGRTAIVRQVLAVKDGRLWLLSAFSPDGESTTSGGSFATLDDALKSVEFTAP